MNIGFYHDAAGTRQSGGIAIYTQRMAAELSYEHDVYLYTRSGDISSTLDRSEVTIVETPQIDSVTGTALGKLTPLTGQDVQKLEMASWGVRNGVFDHIEETLDILYTFQYMDDLIVSNLVDVPTVFAFHSLSTVGLGSHLRETISQTEQVLANSEPTAREIEETFGYDVDGIVHPGIDHERFTPNAVSAFDSDRPIILFVGRLIAEKGVFDLLEAVSMLKEPAELHLVGRGNERAIRTRSRELGIGDEVVLDGVVSHTDLPRYYAGADVFCLPTYDESFGMVNVEAMACGTPPVTTNLAGIETYATHEYNAHLVEPGKPREIADSLERLLEDPSYRESLGERASDVARGYSWCEQAHRLEQFCADTLGNEATVDDGTSFEDEPKRSGDLHMLEQ